MTDREWSTMNESELEELLRDSMSEPPPEDIVTEVTPWKRATNRILVGLALCTVTLNFWCLNYILPAIGMVLTLLGFRALRQENRWLRNCFIITAIRSAYFFPFLILNTMPIQSAVYASPVMQAATIINLGLQFVMLFSLWRGLRAVQEKAGLPPGAGGALALLVWFAVICLLALVHYSGLLIAGILLVGYFFILRNLWKLSKELEEAGYAVQAASVKVPDRTIVITIYAALCIGCVCGYLFGDSYPMDWNEIDSTEHHGVEEIKEQLLELGFPEYVLNDLTAEDIAACEGALQIVVDVYDHPVNDGRRVTTKEPGPPGSGVDWCYTTRIVYDVKELRITGVGVQIPGERERWIIIQHFLWTTNPGFYGTESIQLWPTYRTVSQGWGSAGDVTGRVLYDKDGTTYTAPYYSLGDHTFTSNSIFFGEQTSTDVFATFSMPRSGENHRGYVAYPIIEMQDGYITDCCINYTHQRFWLQYPAMTAMEKRMTNGWSDAGVFKTVQDSLQFYPTDEAAKLISAVDTE